MRSITSGNPCHGKSFDHVVFDPPTAYRLLGALPDIKFAVLYSLSAMTSYGHANLFLEEQWQLMGALTTTIRFAAARQHQLQLGWSQEEMLDHFLVSIRGSVLRIHLSWGTFLL